ncbi:DUF6503 family protein [Nonlabens ulvanivorans]|uniref:DUF6503 family protein n=1 Tax=Nonlabens ulvanivorans TaxID=906888 RepID=UPI002942B3D8|nr:DUF6503 family protein [Nonlabens ulvanivorans]WOI23700.1 DUF6503 family protein [Nonlabens ulvanivorans]
MKKLLAIAFIASLITSSCKEPMETNVSTNDQKPDLETDVQFVNQAHQLVYDMVQNVGNYNQLLEKQNVIYTYTYQTPDGKTDQSTEMYQFQGELSYGAYQKHERTFPDLTGTIVQGYDGTNYWLNHNNHNILDEQRLKRVAFNRPTNYYWFTMMPKLLDPGVNYDYIKEESIDDNTYDIIKVSFESTDNSPKDIYQLYINRDTKLVDQFLFTVADFNKMEPSLMQMEYENIDGLLIPTKRKYKASDWQATVTDAPWIYVNWTDIKFNNDINNQDFQNKAI